MKTVSLQDYLHRQSCLCRLRNATNTPKRRLYRSCFAQRQRSPKSHGIRVVFARPPARAARLLVRVNHADDGAVRSRNHQERAGDDDKDAKAHHELPPERPLLLALAPVVVQPHAAHRLEAQKRAEEGADEGDEAVEDGDGARDEVGDEGGAKRAAQPDRPVDDAVGRQVDGSAEDAHKDVLGRQLHAVSMGTVCLGFERGRRGLHE